MTNPTAGADETRSGSGATRHAAREAGPDHGRTSSRGARRAEGVGRAAREDRRGARLRGAGDGRAGARDPARRPAEDGVRICDGVWIAHFESPVAMLSATGGDSRPRSAPGRPSRRREIGGRRRTRTGHAERRAAPAESDSLRGRARARVGRDRAPPRRQRAARAGARRARDSGSRREAQRAASLERELECEVGAKDRSRRSPASPAASCRAAAGGDAPGRDARGRGGRPRRGDRRVQGDGRGLEEGDRRARRRDRASY